MAEKKLELTPEEYMNERVLYEAHLTGVKEIDTDDVRVIVNGKIFVIKRGVPVQIPRYVVAVIESKDRESRKAIQQIADLETMAGF